MYRELTFVLLAITLPVGLTGQVVVDKPIVLTDALPEGRQVTGLSVSDAPDAILTAAMEQGGTFRVINAPVGNTWMTEVVGSTGAPTAGTQLIVLAPQTAPGPIQISVNGFGPFEVIIGPGEPLDGAQVPAGAALSLIMDGTAFQLQNGHVYSRRSCPTGTVQVDEGYCIETTKHAAVDFFEANTACNDLGLRLCSWGEFVVACQRAAQLGLVGATSSWEWTDSASNENSCARLVGAGSCLSAGTSFVTGSTPRNFRCCYSR